MINAFRAAFALVILMLVAGFIGGRYLVTALVSGAPDLAMAPTATTHHAPVAAATNHHPAVATATAAPTLIPAPTATPTPHTPTPHTATPRVTASPTASPTASALSKQKPKRESKHVARKRPTPTATPRPTPTTGIVELARYWINSTSARTGTTIGIGYVINNGTGQTQRLLLGASIKASRALSWLAAVSDPSHDVVAIVPPGVSTHARYFTLAGRLRLGTYDVAWGLRNAATGERDALVAAPAVLHVHR